MLSKDLQYQLSLTLIPGIGDVLAKNLVSYCGSPEKVFRAKKHQLLRIPGIDEMRAKSILKFKDFAVAEEEITFIVKNKIVPLFYLDQNYPARLKGLTDAPVMLFTKGNLNLNAERIVAIVGTRHATEYGKALCESLVDGMKDFRVSIVSGLAYGIDIAAHRAALQSGLATWGVLGHGLNRIYPQQHRATAVKMLEMGGLITEFRSTDNFEPENFPKRNRIVAGLCDATIVIESAVKGGALITAEIANSYNRDVFVMPGRVGDKYSEGCNYFIKTNKANLVECAEDVAFFMGWQEKKSTPIKQKEIFIELTADEKKILSLLQQEAPLHVDMISQQSEMFGSQLAVALLNLEFKGVIISLPGKMYKIG